MMLLILIVLIALALIYEFGNGMNDAANSVATLIATKALSTKKALFIAAAGNFIGPFILGVSVAKTIGKGVVNIEAIAPGAIVCILLSSIIWTYLATYKGLPISVTHSIVGSLIGIGLTINISTIIFQKILIIFLFIFVAPIFGFLSALILEVLVISLLRNSSLKWNFVFRKLQILSSLLFNIGHGANDSQNGMGIIAMSLLVLGFTTKFDVPYWVIIICAAAISLGTYVGGKRVIRTTGMKITELRPHAGFSSEVASALSLTYSTLLGIPVSSSHIIGGSIVGSGIIKGASRVRWRNMKKIITAWVITIPLTALSSWILYSIVRLF